MTLLSNFRSFRCLFSIHTVVYFLSSSISLYVCSIFCETQLLIFYSHNFLSSIHTIFHFLFTQLSTFYSCSCCLVDVSLFIILMCVAQAMHVWLKLTNTPNGRFSFKLPSQVEEGITQRARNIQVYLESCQHFSLVFMILRFVSTGLLPLP
jgi:hypothetical protein